MSKIYIGTSGWNYKHWVGRFYPEKFPADRMLDFYAQQFQTVELNNSFYHLPSTKSFETWREKTSDDFVFAVKGSRFITHMKKLKDPKPATEKFLAHVERLEEKLGPILFQLPPRGRLNTERLASFLEVLPREHRYAFEFREPSWFADDVYGLLKQYNAALCIYHMAGYDSPQKITADFVYLRFHGTQSTYGGAYDDEALQAWGARIRAWRRQQKDVYAYFNNDPEAHAVRNAKALRLML